jgi:hypothetical protein
VRERREGKTKKEAGEKKHQKRNSEIVLLFSSIMRSKLSTDTIYGDIQGRVIITE